MRKKRKRVRVRDGGCRDEPFFESFNKDIFSDNIIMEREFKGSIRALTVKPTMLKVLKFTDDDLNPGKYKIKIEFSLQRGSYATMLIRELMK